MMKPSVLAAGLAVYAAAAAAASASAQDILTPAGHITLSPGQSIQQVIAHAAFIDSLTHGRQAGAPASRVSPQANGNPLITSGAMLSNTLEVGSAGSVPTMQFSYSTGVSGLGAAGFTFTSPNGQSAFNLTYFAGAIRRNGNIVFAGQSGAPSFAQPGRWTLTSATINDGAFNFTSYTAAQAAALIENPVIDVVNNGPVDTTPPVVTSGTILTPKISLSDPLPQFLITLGGTDNLSGVAAGFVIVRAPGNSYGQTTTSLAPIAFTSGSMVASAPILSGDKAGTWSITGFILCDVASNCTSNTQTPAEIKALFGTDTFTVTN